MKKKDRGEEGDGENSENSLVIFIIEAIQFLGAIKHYMAIARKLYSLRKLLIKLFSIIYSLKFRV
jgi:hypothetical protein